MSQYVVELEAAVPALAAASPDEQERRTDALLDALEALAGDGAYGIEVPAAWGGLGGKLGGRFYVYADGASAALERGMGAMTDALSRIGCSGFAWVCILAEPFAPEQDEENGEARQDEQSG